MFKKIIKLVCFSSLALTANLLADGKIDEKIESAEIYSGGFTVGSSLNTATSGTRTFLMFGYINKCFLADVGFNYNYINARFENASFVNFMGHLGLRNQVFQNLFVTYGVTGSVVAGDFWDSGLPYSVGAFTGLDLQITRHILLSAKVNPYVFEHVGFDVNSSVVFGSGSIAVSYVF